MSNEMIERVAKVLFSCHLGITKKDSIRLAKLAIEAMKEPTEAMLDAGFNERNVSGAQHRGLPLIWKAMIEAALKDG